MRLNCSDCAVDADGWKTANFERRQFGIISRSKGQKSKIDARYQDEIPEGSPHPRIVCISFENLVKLEAQLCPGKTKLLQLPGNVYL